MPENIFNLPIELLCCICFEWISLKDHSPINSALCNNLLRSEYLNILEVHVAVQSSVHSIVQVDSLFLAKNTWKHIISLDDKGKYYETLVQFKMSNDLSSVWIVDLFVDLTVMNIVYSHSLTYAFTNNCSTYVQNQLLSSRTLKHNWFGHYFGQVSQTGERSGVGYQCWKRTKASQAGFCQSDAIEGTDQWRSFRGQWCDDQMNGNGCLRFHAGHVYVGNLVNHNMHGIGFMLYYNGDTFRGDWIRGSSAIGSSSVNKKNKKRKSCW
jgi:hypothetical protein